MNLLVHLSRSLRATLVSVPLGSLVVGLLFGVAAAVQEGSAKALPDTLFVGILLAVGGAIAALLPALAYGALAHAYLMAHRRATYATSLLVGILPGLCMMALDTGGGILVIAFGSSIALFTHWIVTSSMLNSFVPTTTDRDIDRRVIYRE